LPAQDHGQPYRPPGARGVLELLELSPEHFPKEKEKSAEGLVPGGGADLLAGRQVGQVGPDLGRTQPGRVVVAVETRDRCTQEA
jgi:hypothetical protein